MIDENFSVWKNADGNSGSGNMGGKNRCRALSVSRSNIRVRSMFLLAFRTGWKKRSQDAEALMLIDMILNNSVAGLIDLNLNQQQKVRQAGSSLRSC